MPQRMACSLTVEQVKNRTKTVTRRDVESWGNRKAGDPLTLIEKGMGLPKGAKQVVLAEAVVVSVRVERLGQMGPADCAREGFPDMTPGQFAKFWCDSHGYKSLSWAERLDVVCRRIEWRYL